MKRTVEAAGPPLNARGEPVAVIPVVEEELNVAKRQMVTGKVRITKTIREEEAVVDEPLRVERVQVERVPIDRVVEAVPETRREGDVTIIPVVEEVLIKRLVLKEEIRITRTVQERHHPEKVILRREEVKIERAKGSGSK